MLAGSVQWRGGKRGEEIAFCCRERSREPERIGAEALTGCRCVKRENRTVGRLFLGVEARVRPQPPRRCARRWPDESKSVNRSKGVRLREEREFSVKTEVRFARESHGLLKRIGRRRAGRVGRRREETEFEDARKVENEKELC